MPITTTLDPAKVIETIELIIAEWLTDPACFNTGASAIATVHAYRKQDDEQKDMKIVDVAYAVDIASIGSTGAGALRKEAVFKDVVVEMLIRGKKPLLELDVINKGDILDNYFRSQTADEGRQALGGAGLKKAVLSGPIRDDNDKRYFLHRWFLTCRVLVQNP